MEPIDYSKTVYYDDQTLYNMLIFSSSFQSKLGPII